MPSMQTPVGVQPAKQVRVAPDPRVGRKEGEEGVSEMPSIQSR